MGAEGHQSFNCPRKLLSHRGLVLLKDRHKPSKKPELSSDWARPLQAEQQQGRGCGQMEGQGPGFSQRASTLPTEWLDLEENRRKPPRTESSILHCGIKISLR